MLMKRPNHKGRTNNVAFDFQDARKACADATLSQVRGVLWTSVKLKKNPVWFQLLLFYRSQLISTPSGESRCVQDEHCGDIWLRSTPCTGAPIPGRMARMCMWRTRGSVVGTGLISSCLTFLISVCTGSWSVPLKMANSLSGTVILQTRWVLCFLSDKWSYTVYYIHCGHLHSGKVAVWAWRKGRDVTTVHIHTQFTHLLTLRSFSPVPRSRSLLLALLSQIGARQSYATLATTGSRSGYLACLISSRVAMR